jgi:hypothetical protein
MAVYDDGHGYCFKCGMYESDKTGRLEKPAHMTSTPRSFMGGEPTDLPHRRLSKDTCRFYGYTVDGNVEVAS